MTSILFVLKDPGNDKPQTWYKAVEAISAIAPNSGTTTYINNQVLLLIRAGNDSPLLSRAIQIAVNCRVSYKLIFIEKATEWDYEPPVV